MSINPPKGVGQWHIFFGALPVTSVQHPPGLYPPHATFEFSLLWVDVGKLWRLQDNEVTHGSGSLYHLCR